LAAEVALPRIVYAHRELEVPDAGKEGKGTEGQEKTKAGPSLRLKNGYGQDDRVLR
jgi:hypothetical protein